MPGPITPQLVYELTNISGPSISQDGSQLAFARSKVDRDAMETRSQIMAMTLPDAEPIAFTRGSSDTVPKFSTDGHSIGFLRPDDKGKRQIWLIPGNASCGSRSTPERSRPTLVACVSAIRRETARLTTSRGASSASECASGMKRTPSLSRNTPPAPRTISEINTRAAPAM